MKKSVLVEKVKEVTSWSEAWDLFEAFFDDQEQTGKLFTFVKKENGWSCSVVDQTKKVQGKEVTYKQTFVLRETADTMTTAFQKAALRYLEK